MSNNSLILIFLGLVLVIKDQNYIFLKSVITAFSLLGALKAQGLGCGFSLGFSRIIVTEVFCISSRSLTVRTEKIPPNLMKCIYLERHMRGTVFYI